MDYWDQKEFEGIIEIQTIQIEQDNNNRLLESAGNPV